MVGTYINKRDVTTGQSLKTKVGSSIHMPVHGHDETPSDGFLRGTDRERQRPTESDPDVKVFS